MPLFQFTRPRGARQQPEVVAPQDEVSIHAPARGATPVDQHDFAPPGVSIHAPTRGATTSLSFPISLRRFQFTRPRGARRDRRVDHRPVQQPVSIHAPTRGATRFPAGGISRRCFNSRAHAGRDSADEQRLVPEAVSIHAPTRGATPPPLRRFRCSRCFNSRAHAGRDGAPLNPPTTAPVSIHAPTRGATGVAASDVSDQLFQFTRPRGARLSRVSRLPCSSCFNSRAHAGRDLVMCTAIPSPGFQFTRPRGARRRPGPRRAGRHVSIHAPTRGATWQYYPGGLHARVSIHAPTRGATTIVLSAVASIRSFNSRAHAGRDNGSPKTRRGQSSFQFTRPRGARRWNWSYWPIRGLFQFTRPRGARPARGAGGYGSTGFQFTRPRGARL